MRWLRSCSARSRLFVAALLASAPLCAAEPPTLEQAIGLHLEGRYDEALAAYHSITADPTREPLEVSGARNAACVLLNDHGEFAAALVECREAERIRRELGDRFRLALTLNNLALSHQYLGESQAAESRLREALALDRELGETEEEAVVLANLAALEIGAGRYGTALDWLASAEALAREHQDAAWSAGQSRIARLNRAVVLERLGAHQEALETLRTLAAERELEPRHEAALAANLGVVYRNLGDPRRAERELERAATIFRALGDRGGLANALLNLGQIAELHLRRPDLAAARYGEAIAEAQAGSDRSEEIVARLFRGRLRVSAGRTAEGREDLATALAAAEAAGDAETSWNALFELARADRSDGLDDQALDRLERAIEGIEGVRAGVRSRTMASGFLADKRAVFALAIELAARRAQASGRRDDLLHALALVERAKARELLDALGRAGRPPLAAAELGRMAAEPGTALELYVAESSVWRFRLGSGRLELASCGPAEELRARSARVLDALGRGDSPDPVDLERLGTALLAGLGQLEGDLHIGPDGLLRYLPFELLAAAPEASTLVETTTISYWPSLSVRSGGEQGAQTLTFAGFADVSPSAAAGTARALLAQRLALAPLPSSRAEVENAAATLGGESRLALGADATEEALRSLAPGGARVLHFATHALAEERLTDGAVLLLAPSGADDGLLTAAEIAALDLPVELTVLAACRSALGSTADGRALSSLTGAFLAAGAAGVVASLWEVGDATAAVFMAQLYRELVAGRRPADALVRVKRKLRADPRWSDPSVWSAFVLIGDPGPVASPWPARLPWVLAVAAALAAALALAARYGAGSRRSSAAGDPPSSPPAPSSATTRTR